jgi:hypothetical protein
LLSNSEQEQVEQRLKDTAKEWKHPN